MIKVLLVKNDPKELEKLLNDGWKVGLTADHPEGALIVVSKQVVVK